MNNEDYIHELGPDRIAELLDAYDELYESLLPMPRAAWDNEILYKKLSINGSMDRMQEMIDVYRYVFEIEKSENVQEWLDALCSTGVLLQAKEILKEI
jgi:hypothetical protein